LLGAIGGTPAKKRVGLSHLVFNLVTGIAAFSGLSVLLLLISKFVDIGTNSLTGKALFHYFKNASCTF
jgi:phosphate:Na+ symporter